MQLVLWSGTMLALHILEYQLSSLVETVAVRHPSYRLCHVKTLNKSFT